MNIITRSKTIHPIAMKLWRECSSADSREIRFLKTGGWRGEEQGRVIFAIFSLHLKERIKTLTQ